MPLKTCPIHPEWAETVIAVFYTYMEKCGLRGYDDATGRGDIRSIVVRDVAGNLIVTVVATHRDLKGIGELIRLLSEKLSSFSLYLNLNDADTNVVFGEEFILLHGAGAVYRNGMRHQVRSGGEYLYTGEFGRLPQTVRPHRSRLQRRAAARRR